LRPDGKRALYQPDAFLHADQPQTSFASDFFGIKPVAHIGYFHRDLIKTTAQSDSGLGRVGMFPNVSQAFLGNPVQAQRDIVGNGLRNIVRIEFGGDAILFGEGSTFILERGRQPEVVQYCGVELTGNAMNILRQITDLLCKLQESAAKFLG
jgi:hypothetical protein